MFSWILIVYTLILLLVSVLSFRKGFRNIFRTENRIPWFLAGFSIFLINPDTINVLTKMGIVAEEGYSGMWIFYSGVLGAGLLPILFAPLWSRLKFMTDNQFILLRFTGRPAQILHLFRAIYVGYLVVALFIAQVFIGLSKLLIVFFDISYARSFLVISVLLILIIAKNSLRLKVRTDFLNGMVYILAFALGAFFVVKAYGGLPAIYARLNASYTDYTRLFPASLDKSSFGSLPNVLVYFLIQWWSINVLDGAGPEAQRFMNTRGAFPAFKAAFMPLILFTLVFLLHSFVIDAGILMVNESATDIPVINGRPDSEAGFISMYSQAMPGGLSALVFLAFFVGFAAFLEATINWGSGFLVVDVFRTYLFRKRSDRFYTLLSYTVMLVVGISGIFIAWYNTRLLGLQKFIFAMGAGVGPVFILRWFWWRINAWSQFTAMVASLFLAVGWDVLYNNSTVFHHFVNVQTSAFNLGFYALKIIYLTVLVSACWLTVTFITKADSMETLENFVKKVKPGGYWLGMNHGTRGLSRARLVLVAIYPVISILPFIIIWAFKFGSRLQAWLMIPVWFALLWFTVHYMHRDER
ncbi:MAG TPA: hypothetical protein VE870_06980 [Bacteroidales bacterium]|nr:hypothetical protein [Bacteroidales bacterium]